MDVGASVEANSKPLELMKPCKRSLDDPTVETETTAVLGAAFRYERTDTKSSELVAVCLRIVASIREQVVRPLTRTTDHSSDRRHGMYQRKKLGDVVTVRTGESNGERESRGVNEKVMLAPGTTAI